MLIQPGKVRRHAVRAAGRRRRRCERRAGDGGDEGGGFGAEVKRRIIIGTYALSSGYYEAYYGQAQKVRTLISRDFDRRSPTSMCWSPSTPITAFKIGEKVDDPWPCT